MKKKYKVDANAIMLQCLNYTISCNVSFLVLKQNRACADISFILKTYFFALSIWENIVQPQTIYVQILGT